MLLLLLFFNGSFSVGSVCSFWGMADVVVAFVF